MQNADSPDSVRFANHRARIILSLSRMHDERLVHFARERDLRRERGALRIAR